LKTLTLLLTLLISFNLYADEEKEWLDRHTAARLVQSLCDLTGQFEDVAIDAGAGRRMRYAINHSWEACIALQAEIRRFKNYNLFRQTYVVNVFEEYDRLALRYESEGITEELNADLAFKDIQKAISEIQKTFPEVEPVVKLTCERLDTGLFLPRNEDGTLIGAYGFDSFDSCKKALPVQHLGLICSTAKLGFRYFRLDNSQELSDHGYWADLESCQAWMHIQKNQLICTPGKGIYDRAKGKLIQFHAGGYTRNGILAELNYCQQSLQNSSTRYVCIGHPNTREIHLFDRSRWDDDSGWGSYKKEEDVNKCFDKIKERIQ
jgi:hypothetical protein